MCALPARDGTTSLQHDSNDCGGHEIGHRAAEHGANAEASEVGMFVGSERADTADLNSDGAEVREAAESESGDGEGARIKRVFHRAEALEGDEFVGDHAKAE